jgi:hypothetical protein
MTSSTGAGTRHALSSVASDRAGELYTSGVDGGDGAGVRPAALRDRAVRGCCFAPSVLKQPPRRKLDAAAPAPRLPNSTPGVAAACARQTRRQSGGGGGALLRRTHAVTTTHLAHRRRRPRAAARQCRHDGKQPLRSRRGVVVQFPSPLAGSR